MGAKKKKQFTMTQLSKKIAARIEKSVPFSPPSHREVRLILAAICELEVEDAVNNLADHTLSPIKCLEREIDARQT